MTQIDNDMIDQLRWMIHASPHSATSLSLHVGLGRNTVARWLARTRRPSLNELNVALDALGYKLAFVPKASLDGEANHR